MKRLQPSSVPIIWKKDKGRFRADLHGTIFVACNKLATGLRHDLRLSQCFKTYFKMQRHFF